MIEQELASIIRFVLDAAGNPTPYYWSVPQGFERPAVFFPTPEIDSDGETLATYRLEYVWYLQFFHNSTQEAHEMARTVYEAIKKDRNLIKLLDETGKKLSKGIRLKEPSLKTIDEGVAQLSIKFTSRRPYNIEDVEKAVYFTSEITDKSDGTWHIAPEITERTRSVSETASSEATQYSYSLPLTGNTVCGEDK